jgi:hypothetical protein
MAKKINYDSIPMRNKTIEKFAKNVLEYSTPGALAGKIAKGIDSAFKKSSAKDAAKHISNMADTRLRTMKLKEENEKLRNK